MDLKYQFRLALDPALILAARGLPPDPWQRELLHCHDRQLLLCCSRQSGKSTVVSALALHVALFLPGSLVLLLSPSVRQSGEIYRKVLDGHDTLGAPLSLHRSELRLELSNGSRVLCLPGREETVRSFSGVNLLVLDEAARVEDDLYHSVRPMLAVSGGKLVALSTPFGRRGWFYREWVGDGPWRRFQVTWRDCPRIRAEFIAEERRAMGDLWVAQEYETTFTALEGVVYPAFASVLVDTVPVLSGRRVGGIDFGWRNPFAAVWGVLDRDDVLWITGERYLRSTGLADHAAALKALGPIEWWADPAGATDIDGLRRAGLCVRAADNAIRLGIAAVSGRIQSGRLRVLQSACPELEREAGLYRYPTEAERHRDGEAPVDEHNHALGALRYLVAGIDARYLARARQSSPDPSHSRDEHPDPESLWTTL